MDQPPLTVAIVPKLTHTEVLVMSSVNRVILKAQLQRFPGDPHAVMAWLKSLARWEGRDLLCAVVVGEPGGEFDLDSFLDAEEGGEEIVTRVMMRSVRADRRTMLRPSCNSAEFARWKRLLQRKVML